MHIIIGLGDYKLLPQFQAASRSPDELQLITCSSPTKISSQRRNQDKEVASPDKCKGMV